MIRHRRMPTKTSPGQNWYYVGELVTLKCPWAPIEKPTLKMATIQDVPWCRAVAYESFTYDRLHADARNDEERHAAGFAKADFVDGVIRAQFTFGAGSVVFVEHGGFIACRNARIDLIAVSPLMRRQGKARRLVKAAIQFYGGNVTVGTQGTNEPSLALYRSMGFVEISREYDYHCRDAYDVLPSGDVLQIFAPAKPDPLTESPC